LFAGVFCGVLAVIVSLKSSLSNFRGWLSNLRRDLGVGLLWNFGHFEYRVMSLSIIEYYYDGTLFLRTTIVDGWCSCKKVVL